MVNPTKDASRKVDLVRGQKGLLITVGVAVILFFILVIFVKAGTAANLNREIYHSISPLIHSGLTSVMKAVSFLAEWYVWLVLAAVLCVFAKTRGNFGWTTGFATLAGGAVATIAKDLFQIARPHILWLTQETGYGFPSGHATISAAFVATFLYFLWRSKVKKGWKIFATVLGILWLLTIGFSRIYLGVHNPTDVLGGYFAGVAVAAATIFLKTIFQVVVRPKSSRK